MFERKKGECRIEFYQSIRDFLKTQDSRENTYHAEYSRTGYNKHFNGVANYDEAVTLLTGGYSEPVKAMDGVRTDNNADSMRPAWHNDIIGGAVCVPLALAGVPTCMLNREPQPRADKVVRLLVDVGRHAGVTREEITAFGKNVVGLTRALENAGRRVQIDAMFSVCDWCNTMNAARLPIKTADQPLDIKRICFPLLHAAFQRVFKFDWYDKLPNSPAVFGYGNSLAYHVNNADEYTRFIAPLVESGEHLITITTDFDELKKTI